MNLTSIGVTESVQDPATPHTKANKQAKLVERKVCLFQMQATEGEHGRHLSKGQLSPYP